MIRNASLKDNNNLLKFIPSSIENFSFGDIAEELCIGGETLEACAMFDKSVSLLLKQADDANDYLRKMVQRVEGFADDDDEKKYLKNFYIVVPALCSNYVTHLQNSKERLMKRDDADAFISDDGFSLGVVYLLRVLGVSDNFNGLNWFESMEATLAED
jgi:WASH complex subunit 7